MTVRMSWAAVAFISAIALGRQANNPISPAVDGDDEAQLRVAIAARSNEDTVAAANNAAPHHSIINLAKEFESGKRSTSFIEAELDNATGNTPAIKWSTSEIKRPYKLAKIISHVLNPDNDFEMLFSYSFEEGRQPEMTFTRYSNHILEADEKNIRASLVFSRLIEVHGDKVVFNRESRRQFFFSLKPHTMKDSYTMREPEVEYQFGAVQQGSFNPLSVLTTEDSNIGEISEYLKEIVAGDAKFSVYAIPRFKDEKTLTIEVQIRNVESDITNSFVLIYNEMEPLNNVAPLVAKNTNKKISEKR